MEMLFSLTTVKLKATVVIILFLLFSVWDRHEILKQQIQPKAET